MKPLTALLGGLVLFSLTAAAKAGGSETRTRLEAILTSTDTPASGKAKFEMRPDRIRLSVEVEDVVDAAEVEISVGGETHTLPLDAQGFGDLNLDSRDGDSVPVLQSGDSVVVSAGGIVILGGTFSPKQ